MENPEEILHSLEEFSKLKPKDIPRELEDYLCFVAKTGDPVYQWGTIKSLFREKLINVITDFYESCPSVEIPPCPNVEVFNYDSMKTFILEKLDTFAAAPFTVQRICELLTTPRKEYNRIDKYMRALEKNILVVSTTEPGFRRTTENGEGIVNGLESEHVPDTNSSNNDINVEEMDDTPVWSRITPETVAYQNTETNVNITLHPTQSTDASHPTFSADSRIADPTCGSSIDSVITCRPSDDQPYVSIEPVASDSCLREENIQESDVTVTITAIPAAVQKRRDSIEPVVSSADDGTNEQTSEFNAEIKENLQASSSSSNNVEITLQESLPSEAEAAVVEEVVPSVSISAVSKKEPPGPYESNDSGEPTESAHNESPLIQIPIISEISAGDGGQDIDDDKEGTVLSSNSAQEPVLECDLPLKEQIEPVTDPTSEVSTTVTSSNETVESQTVICEMPAVVSKATSVSSTDEISNEASDIVLNSTELDRASDEVRNYDEETSQEGSLSDCVADTSSNSEPEGLQDKQSDQDLKSTQEFATSSTSQHSMDIDITEESCQEAPTSDG